ncbi:hypothetical protein NPIL_651431 [Nephila pilipes]|uniref:Uncharacterized protein n=1 Tax=Nephila pilipes TaxID=299642 RepID=A0A8X6MRY2_NEPPI|nr:hypothetical protein NPIL_651431 [Nephila pilipes]
MESVSASCQRTNYSPMVAALQCMISFGYRIIKLEKPLALASQRTPLWGDRLVVPQPTWRWGLSTGALTDGTSAAGIKGRDDGYGARGNTRVLEGSENETMGNRAKSILQVEPGLREILKTLGVSDGLVEEKIVLGAPIVFSETFLKRRDGS